MASSTTSSSSIEMQEGGRPTSDWSEDGYPSTIQNDRGSASSLQRRRLIVGLLLILMISLISFDYFTERRIEDACISFISWVEKHPLWGVLAVICVYTVATILVRKTERRRLQYIYSCSQFSPSSSQGQF